MSWLQYSYIARELSVVLEFLHISATSPPDTTKTAADSGSSSARAPQHEMAVVVIHSYSIVDCKQH